MSRHLKIGGTPSEIGSAHGRQLATEIAATIAIYRSAFNLSEDRVVAEARRFAEPIRAYAPALGEEIDAIARGSQQPAHWIYALNARSELMAASARNSSATWRRGSISSTNLSLTPTIACSWPLTRRKFGKTRRYG